MIFLVPTCCLWQHSLLWCFVWALKKAFFFLPPPKLLFLLSFFFFWWEFLRTQVQYLTSSVVFWGFGCFVFFYWDCFGVEIETFWMPVSSSVFYCSYQKNNPVLRNKSTCCLTESYVEVIWILNEFSYFFKVDIWSREYPLPLSIFGNDARNLYYSNSQRSSTARWLHPPSVNWEFLSLLSFNSFCFPTVHEERSMEALSSVFLFTFSACYFKTVFASLFK